MGVCAVAVAKGGDVSWRAHGGGSGARKVFGALGGPASASASYFLAGQRLGKQPVDQGEHGETPGRVGGPSLTSVRAPATVPSTSGWCRWGPGGSGGAGGEVVGSDWIESSSFAAGVRARSWR